MGTRRLRRRFWLSPVSGADDLAGLDARGADLQLLGRAATGRGAHRLDVRVPAAVGPPVRVGHVVAAARSLATDVAHASHGVLLRFGFATRVPLTLGPGNPTRLPDRRPAQPIAPVAARGGENVGAG